MLGGEYVTSSVIMSLKVRWNVRLLIEWTGLASGFQPTPAASANKELFASEDPERLPNSEKTIELENHATFVILALAWLRRVELGGAKQLSSTH
jgi:hypothetical protein